MLSMEGHCQITFTYINSKVYWFHLTSFLVVTGFLTPVTAQNEGCLHCICQCLITGYKTQGKKRNNHKCMWNTVRSLSVLLDILFWSTSGVYMYTNPCFCQRSINKMLDLVRGMSTADFNKTDYHVLHVATGGCLHRTV